MLKIHLNFAFDVDLIVVSVPRAPPWNIQAIDVKCNSATIWWKAPQQDGKCHQMEFIVSLKVSGNVGWIVLIFH